MASTYESGSGRVGEMGWREANLVHSINAHMYSCVNVAYNEPAGPGTHCSQGMRNHDA